MARHRPHTPLKQRIIENSISDPKTGCWVWQKRLNDRGYATLKVDSRYKYASRISYELHHGPIPTGLLIRHKCDNPGCVNPAHLEVGTHADNMRDMKLRGRAHKHNGSRRGSRNPNAKLTEEQVRAIRTQLGQGEKQAILAHRYGVSRSTIASINTGLVWNEGQ